MSSVQAAIFDKDGTLFDFSSTWEAWAAAFLRKMAADEERARQLGTAIGFDLGQRRFSKNSVVIAGTPGEIVEVLHPMLAPLTPDEILSVLNDEAINAPQVEAVPLRSYLSRLRAMGLKLGVVTNDAEVPARAHLNSAGAEAHFDFIAGFDSGFGAKPAPGQLLAFAKAMNIAPENIVMVGDSTHDLIAAKRAGMRGVGVLTGLAEEHELLPYAEVIFPDIGHVEGWLAAQ